MIQKTTPEDENKIHELKKAFVFLRQDGVIQIDTKTTEEYSVEDAKEVTTIIQKIGKGKKFPVLMIVKNYMDVDKETRKFYGSKEATINKIAEAFVINSSALKIIANFYIRIEKPNIPSKIFTNTEDAITWLKTFM